MMNAVDHYVVYDDGLYRPRGWINRNRITVAGEEKYITVPTHRSPKKRIKDVDIIDDGRFRKKIYNTICHSYHKAPYFEQCIDIISETIDYLMNSINTIRQYLEITVPMSMSSQIERKSQTAQARGIEICSDYKADIYINAIGGMELYSREDFGNAGIDLRFLRTKEFQYQQFGEKFYSNLSIINVMMFNAPERIRDYLNEYELV